MDNTILLFWCSRVITWSGTWFSILLRTSPFSKYLICLWIYNWNVSLDFLSQVRAPSPWNGWLFLPKLIGKSSPGWNFCRIRESWKRCFLPVSLDDVGHIHRAAGDVCSQGGLVKNIITAWSKSQDKKWEEACALGNWTRPSLSNAMQSMMVSTGSYLCKNPHHYHHDYLQKLITEARWRRCQYRPNISASATVSPDASLPTK